MKNILFITGMAAIFVLSGCLKDETEEQRAEEEKLLQEYVSELEQQGVEVNETENGLYYVVKDSGQGPLPEYGDLIEVQLTGRVLDGGRIIETTSADTAKKYGFYDSTQFYGSFRYNFNPNAFTTGYNIGVSMMEEGAFYKLIIPSELAYGSLSLSGIPAYSSLIYDVRLENVILNPAEYEREQLMNYLEENNISPGDSTESGLYFIPLEEGTDDSIQSKDIVSVHYELMNLEGETMQKSRAGEPFEFQIGETSVIEGFEEAVSMMTLDQKARVIIPWYRGYGEHGFQRIPPYMTLIYEIEVVQLE